MIGRLVALELKREARARDVLTVLVLVGGLVAVVADLAYHDLPERAEVASGTLWLGLAFGAALGLARHGSADGDRAAFETLLTFPASRTAVFFAAVAANALLLVGLAAALVALHVVLAGDALRATDALALPVVLLGAVGIAVAGTLLAAVAGRTRARAAMTPLLLLPVLAPVLVAGLHATADVLHGGGWDDVRAEVMLLAGYDLAFLAVAALLFEHVVED